MSFIIAFAGGVVIGIFFYGGLWFTVRALLTTRHPVLVTISSFWARTLVALAGFMLAMNGRWQNAVVCAAGFGVARLFVSLLLPDTGGSPRCT